MQDVQEQIICSAIWYKELPLVKNDIPSSLLRPVNCETGIVFCGHRHPQCMYQMVAITGLRSFPEESGEQIQGFLTNKNRFVDRKEGAQIFIANGGVLRYSDDTLYSEDLY